MSKRDIRIGIVAFVTLVTTLVLVSSPRVQAAQLAGEASEGKHCVAHLEPINPDSDASSTVTELGCFSTFEEAISVATDGAVKLSSDVLPSELTEEMLRARGMGTASSSVVIGVDYDMGNTCETMGYMNNRTSSERWRYQ